MYDDVQKERIYRVLCKYLANMSMKAETMDKMIDELAEAAQQSVQADEVPAWLCECGRKHIKVHYGFTCLCGAVLRR